jgi:hypothetical protein
MTQMIIDTDRYPVRQIHLGSDLDQLIEIYEEATNASPLLINDDNVMDFITAEEMREGAIYGIALILGIASPNPKQSVTDEQWNTCIDYINTRNQSQAA